MGNANSNLETNSNSNSNYVKQLRSMPNNADDTIRYLMRLLECPVCLEPMGIPIEQCSNGHYICHECRKLVSDCPTCRRRLKGYRNRLAEEFSIYLLSIQCPFSRHGCTKSIFPKDLRTHQKVCCFRPCECRICKAHVSIANIQAHFATEHPQCMLTLPVTLDLHLNPKAQPLSDRSAIIAAHGRLFWFWRHLTDTTLFMAVQHCAAGERPAEGGAGDAAGEAAGEAASEGACADGGDTFTYRVDISDKTGKRELCFAGPVHPEGVRQNDLVEQGQCFGVSKRFLLTLLDSGMVHIKVNLFTGKEAADPALMDKEA